MATVLDVTAGSCRILELPVELIELIMTWNTASLLDLRATCTNLEAKTRKMLIDHFFRDQTFLLADRISMGRLLGISKHPVLSRSLQSITFDLGQLRMFDKRWHELRIAQEVDDDTPTRERRTMLRDRARTYASNHQDVQRYEWEAETELTEIFSNLLTADCIPSITALVINKESRTRRPVSSRLQRLLHHPNPVTSVMVSHARLGCNAVLRALVRSGYPSTALDLVGPQEGVHIPNIQFDNKVLLASRLRRLVLNVDGTDPFEADDQMEIDPVASNMRRFSRFLATATELRELSLAAPPDRAESRRGTLLDRIFSSEDNTFHTALMKLECLETEGIPLTCPAAFKDWITVRRETLQEVKIDSQIRCVDKEAVNLDVWNTIWSAEKEDLKVCINSLPGRAKGRYCREKRFRLRWTEPRARDMIPHINDDCTCISGQAI